MDTKEDSQKKKPKKKKSKEKKNEYGCVFWVFFLNTPRVLDPPLQPTSQ